MKRFVRAVFGGLLLTIATSHGAWAFGVKDVVAMHKSGVADSLILQKIRYSGTRFHLDAKDIGLLKSADVPDAVISAMLKTEGRGYTGPYWRPYHAYYGPYYAPYDYYDPFYPRVSVGLRFGYYGGYRGGFRHARRF